ncbi:selenium cofactor biosynthesis protein YqeC [uncultured Brachyspira sp.]|uniref:selenium cofactor biosynthesis protein YqeC n=1 Tax=uncultured Brachyspira sp. TaxID=221953 RepID=UPI00259BBC12|nr:selenium cofactor biosynthesis protein YqeC [uncultured Brachyspira sp.]
MSKVIIVCGAGGKTSYINNISKKYKNKKVIITTTTKIFKTENYISHIDEETFKNNNIITLGKEFDKDKLTYAGDKELKNALRYADIIFIEADGSKYHALKIPNDKEPVIPDFIINYISEIIVVMGVHAIGRKLSEVCYRYNLAKDLEYNKEVDLDCIKYIAEKYYIKKLKDKYKNANIKLYLNDMTKKSVNNLNNFKKTAFIILASGSSKRFNGNKLLYQFKSLNGKTLFENTIGRIFEVKKMINKDKKIKSIDIQILVMSIYDEILNKKFENKDYEAIYNENHNEGISGSIILGTKEALKMNADSFAFFVCDNPFLKSEDIFMMLKYFYYSQKNIGSMYANNSPSNPAIFSMKYKDDILNLNGDNGALSIIKNNMKDAFFYTINENKLKDIDTNEDLY